MTIVVISGALWTGGVLRLTLTSAILAFSILSTNFIRKHTRTSGVASTVLPASQRIRSAWKGAIPAPASYFSHGSAAIRLASATWASTLATPSCTRCFLPRTPGCASRQRGSDSSSPARKGFVRALFPLRALMLGRLSFATFRCT